MISKFFKINDLDVMDVLKLSFKKVYYIGEDLMASKTRYNPNQVAPNKPEKVSMVSLFALVYKTCATFLEKKRTPDKFYPYMEDFIQKRLKNNLHKSVFRYTMERFKKMDFEKVKRECREIPGKIAEKDDDAYNLILQYEINHLTY